MQTALLMGLILTATSGGAVVATPQVTELAEASEVVDVLSLIGGSKPADVDHVLSLGWNGRLNEAPTVGGVAAKRSAERSVSRGMRRGGSVPSKAQ